MIPQRKGLASRQAHVDLPEGTVEEEHGRQAFTGRASHLYRTAPPTAWVKVEGPLRPWAFDWNQLAPPDQTNPEGDPLVVLSNQDLTVLVSRRSEPMPFFVRDADGDVVYFVHRGEGTLETDYGPLRFRTGDYLVVPKGTTHRVVPETTDNFFLLIEGDEFVLPDKGLLGHHALFDPGVLETPEPDPHDERGSFRVRVRRRGEVTTFTFPHHPLNVVGWQGDLAPFRLNVADFRPVVSPRYHLPPSVHTTFRCRARSRPSRGRCGCPSTTPTSTTTSCSSTTTATSSAARGSTGAWPPCTRPGSTTAPSRARPRGRPGRR
jgi:homogentisate 1,2-dioxygenase